MKLLCTLIAVVLLSVAPAARAQGEPAGAIRVYSSDIHDTSESPSRGGPATIGLLAARNGVSSGKVVVSSPGKIEGLKATMSDLRAPGAAIPATLVQVRYGVPWETTITNHYRPRGADILLEKPLAEFPAGRRGGAKVPIWVTVRTPRAAKPGAYAGRLTVEAKGLSPVHVPVTLDVRPWTVPDTQDWRTWVELLQSPDTLAAEYKIPMWSEKHWAMIARSFEFIGQTGSRVVTVPLIARTNRGNAESMVRWVKTGKGDSGYTYDFSIMDRYLDLAEKHMGKPKRVIFYAWEVYLRPPENEVIVKEGDSRYQKMEKSKQAARYALKGKGPAVTVVGKLGKVDTEYLPRYEDAEGKKLWAPLWQTLREKMAARGLTGAMMLGNVSDIRPTPGEVAVLKDLSGGLPWSSCTHHMRWVNSDPPPLENQLHKMATIGYPAVALDYMYTLNPAKGRTYGWKKPVLHAIYWRFQPFNVQSHCWIRHEAECNITGNQRGVGHLGADFWRTIRDKRDRRVGTVADRFPESYWHSLNVGAWMLAPGLDGPVGTSRLEVFREGVQECEARIAIERVLTEPKLRAKLGDELAGRAQAILDERQRAMWQGRGAREQDFELGLITKYRQYYTIMKKWDARAGNAWFLTSLWQTRTAKLYDVAHEVERKLK